VGRTLSAGQGTGTKNPATPKYRRGKIFQSGPGATRAAGGRRPTRDLLLRSRLRPAAASARHRDSLGKHRLHANQRQPALARLSLGTSLPEALYFSPTRSSKRVKRRAERRGSTSGSVASKTTSHGSCRPTARSTDVSACAVSASARLMKGEVGRGGLPSAAKRSRPRPRSRAVGAQRADPLAPLACLGTQ
jgi:hypothetical protein